MRQIKRELGQVELRKVGPDAAWVLPPQTRVSARFARSGPLSSCATTGNERNQAAPACRRRAGRMTKPATVYVLSDDDAVRDSLDALFQANELPVQSYDSPAGVLQDLPTNGGLLIDLHAKGSDPIELSKQFRGRGLSLPIIILLHRAFAGARPNNAIILQSPVAADELVAAVKNSLPYYR